MTTAAALKGILSDSALLYTTAKLLGIVKDTVPWKSFQLDPYNMTYLFASPEEENTSDFLAGIKPCFSTGDTYRKLFHSQSERCKRFTPEELLRIMPDVQDLVYSHSALHLASMVAMHNAITQDSSRYPEQQMAEVCDQLQALSSIRTGVLYDFEWSHGVNLGYTYLQMDTVSPVQQVEAICTSPILRSVADTAFLESYLQRPRLGYEVEQALGYRLYQQIFLNAN